MNEKIDIYDLIGVLIPGAIFMCLGILCFPATVANLKITQFPEAFSVIVLTAAALFCGHVLQSLASLVEPLIEKTWGGRLSEKALTHGLGDRYLPKDSATRIAKRLAEAIHGDCTTRSKFLFALHLAETAGNPRIGRFSALYAHFRVFLVLSLTVACMLAYAFAWGGLKEWHWADKLGMLLFSVSLVLLFWNRTRQRAIYYVREVLFTSERLLNAPIPNTPAPHE